MKGLSGGGARRLQGGEARVFGLETEACLARGTPVQHDDSLLRASKGIPRALNDGSWE